MARIRTIKPEFPQSESIGRLSRDARLLFIQLWTFVDDAGRARAASRLLASQLYPYDDDAPGLIDDWLEELEREGCVRRYTVNGSSYLDIPKWLEHQKIDKPSGSKLPPFDDPSSLPRETSRDLATDLGPRTKEKDQEDSRCVSAEDGSEEERLSRVFEALWEAYPRRDGPNPKRPSRQAFDRKVVRGADPEAILTAVKNFRRQCNEKGLTGTQYVPQAVTWLNQERFADEEQKPPATVSTSVRIHAGTPQWDAWVNHYRAQGSEPKWLLAKRDWVPPSEWPPEHRQAAE